MKKKLAALLAVATSLALTTCGLVACGGDDDEGGKTTNPGELTASTDFAALTSDKVSATQWAAATAQPAKVTVKNVFTSTSMGNSTDYTYYDGAKIKTVDPSGETYYELKSDNKLVYIYQESEEDNNGQVQQVYYGGEYATTDLLYQDYKDQYDNLKTWIFADYDEAYEDFEYANGAYTMTDEDEDTYTIKFAGTKIAYVKVESSGYTTEYMVYDYGTTTVTLPTNYTNVNTPATPTTLEGTYKVFSGQYASDGHTLEYDFGDVEVVFATSGDKTTATYKLNSFDWEHPDENNQYPTVTYTYNGVLENDLQYGGYTLTLEGGEDETDIAPGPFKIKQVADDTLEFCQTYESEDPNEAPTSTFYYFFKGETLSDAAKTVYEQYLSSLDEGEDNPTGPSAQDLTGGSWNLMADGTAAGSVILNTGNHFEVTLNTMTQAPEVSLTITGDGASTYTSTSVTFNMTAGTLGGAWVIEFNNNFGTWYAEPTANGQALILYKVTITQATDPDEEDTVEADYAGAMMFYHGDSDYLATDSTAIDAFNQFLSNWNWGSDEPGVAASVAEIAGTWNKVVLNGEELSLDTNVKLEITSDSAEENPTYTIKLYGTGSDTITFTGAEFSLLDRKWKLLTSDPDKFYFAEPVADGKALVIYPVTMTAPAPSEPAQIDESSDEDDTDTEKEAVISYDDAIYCYKGDSITDDDKEALKADYTQWNNAWQWSSSSNSNGDETGDNGATE